MARWKKERRELLPPWVGLEMTEDTMWRAKVGCEVWPPSGAGR